MPRSSGHTPSRRSLLLGAAAAAPLVALGAGSAAAATYRDAGGLSMIDGSPWRHPDIRSVDFRFDTAGMVRTFAPSARVTVPPSYAENPDRRYPVLLLLHGAGGFFLDWTEQGNVLEQTEKHEVIVVMPDGGAGSFYSNANAPLPGRQAAWESFLMTRLLPFVHANFRTDENRMAIAGLSMGGWGALTLGQRYWGHFRSISCYSGPADCGGDLDHGLAVRAAIWGAPIFDMERYPRTTNYPGSTWGADWEGTLARSYNPIENVDRYRGKRVFLRTGDAGLTDFQDAIHGVPGALDDFLAEAGENIWGDILEHVVHRTQESFVAELSAAGIDHDYEMIPGATHVWDLWKDNLAEDLPGMLELLNA